MSRPAGLIGAGVAYALTRGVALTLHRRPPGGHEQWNRVNHRGDTVSLLEGPAAALGVAGTVAVLPGLSPRVRGAALLAAGVAGGLGAYDDLVGTSGSKGLRGHLGALSRGELTSGAVKLVGIGTAGLLAGGLLRRGAIDGILAGGVIAGTANLVNLLDLRPGRALKATVLAGSPLAISGQGAGVAGAAVGASIALLPEDLGETSMLGDAGANALGAAVGAAAAATMSRSALATALVGLVGLTLASERVSFTRVIESTPVLREIDGLGRQERA